ncbi:isomerase [Leuconostoc litchii]|uniref:ASCH domain-containing protein n=1 Tax=Leuconostoc litchii TaxID=1981069 RepID=A0A6P2CRR7_9LACO|nr:ASCH domain-containing protein [Leuconostoc litchii]TYC46949.1 ASCH domain-containing protein [Leuconostoc litchii]GMA68858.1 isomerase [Leuconostoc litchii]
MLMKLNHEAFLLMKQGTKTIEIRLNDSKRAQLKKGQNVVFTDLESGEQLLVDIINIYRFSTFLELYQKFGGIQVGSEEHDSVDKMVSQTYEIYSRKQEQDFGVLAIEVKVIL